MPVLRDIAFDLDPEPLLRLQGSAAGLPAVREAAAWACAEAARLARPAAVYDWFAVQHLAAARVQVGTAVLEVGQHADLLEEAHEALVAVMTAGPELEAEAAALMAGPQILRGFLLQAAGDLALGAAGAPLADIVQRAAAERGWGLSLGLAPGSLVGWSLRQQAALCGLLDLAPIGVSVMPGGVLAPAKSASLLVGIGPRYRAQHLRRACCFCGLRQTCLYRDE